MTRFTLSRPGLPGFLFAALALTALAAQAPPAAAAEKESAGAFGERFLRTFIDKDFDTLATFFAPEATVVAVWLDEDPAPESSPAGQWLETVQQETAQVEWTGLDVVESSTLEFAGGAVVSVDFRAHAGRGDEAFTVIGIDSYLLLDSDEGWKVVHYSALEKFGPPQARNSSR